MLRSRRLWISLIVSALFIFLLLRSADFGEIRDSFRDADYFLVLAALPVYFFGLWVRTVRWQYLLRPVAKPSSFRLYPVVIIGLTVNNLIPARVGELARAYVLGEREKVSKMASLGTIAVDRLFDGLTLIPLLAILGVRAGVGEKFEMNVGPIDMTVGFLGLAIIMAVLFGAALLVLAALALSPGLQGVASRFALAVTPKRLRHNVGDLMESFFRGLRSLRSPLDLLVALVSSGVSWTMEALTYYMVGLAFGLDAGFDAYLLVTAGANLAISVLASSGGVGPFEFVTQQTLIAFGAGSTAAAAYAIGVHAVILIPVVALGLYFLWSMNLSLADVVRVSREEEPVAPAGTGAKGGQE